MSNEKVVLFLASYGTSIIRAKAVSYDQIQAELAIALGLPVWQVFTNDDMAHAMNQVGDSPVFTVEDALETAIIHGYTKVMVVPVFFSEGELYKDLNNRINFYRDRIDVELSRPVIYDEASAGAVAKILTDSLKPEKKYEYLFIGHGSAGKYSGRYEALQAALEADGYDNVKVLRLKDKDCLGQAIAWLKQREADVKNTPVIIVPMVIAWGDYMAEELYNAPDSFMWKLRKAGYRTLFTGNGLGQYPEFRTVYIDRVKAIARNPEA